MAVALFRTRISDCHVFSAGLDALIGLPAAEHAQNLLSAKGLSISDHRATRLTGLHCQMAEVILAMDVKQKYMIETRYPFARGRVFRLGEFGEFDVPDPYNKDIEHFEYSLTLIERGVGNWIQKMDKIS
jgi:protein-tyrosine phosphatase